MADRRESQSQKLRDRHKELHALFIDFDHQQINQEDLLYGIEPGINVTKSLEFILNKNSIVGITFADVVKSLSNLDGNTGVVGREAGAISNPTGDNVDSVFRREQTRGRIELHLVKLFLKERCRVVLRMQMQQRCKI